MAGVKKELQEIIMADRNVTGEAALWATVVADIIEAGRRGDRSRVENFIRDGPVDVAAQALMIPEQKLTDLIKQTINGGKMKEKAKKTEVPDFDLIGIEAIANYCGKDHLTLNSWRIHYGFPMKKKSIWRARREEIDAWAAERGRPVTELTTPWVHGYWERRKWEKEIADGTAEVLEGSLQEIGKRVNIPSSALSGWRQFVDFPMEKIEGQKNQFRITRQGLALWLQKHPGERRTFGNSVEYRF